MSTLDDYEVLETLGVGHQGEVEKVKKLSTGEIFALKTFRDVEEAEREIQVLRILSQPTCHPLILCYKGAIDLGDSIGVLTEYISGTTLREMMKYGKGVRDEYLVKLSGYIFSGLAYIHSNGIVHNDISPSNFIFDEKNLKIIDFGMACFYLRDKDMRYTCEPEKTTDNLFELETGEINYNRDLYPKIDVMMTGIMLWRFRNNALGSSKRHYFIEMTQSYQKFIEELEKAPSRTSYYLLHAPRILDELQRSVDRYPSGTDNPKLEKIFRKATTVDPYIRPSASEMAKYIEM